MKEILSSQLDAVSGGWQDLDGSGKRSSDNGGSGSSSRGGNNGGDRGLQSFLSKNSPYGSGSGAGGFWGNGGSARNGYGGNGTGPREAREFGTKR
ncbi:TPA: hypothetical protein SMF45_000510 [Serratia marcescens]|nr:hypothetical protein [Serratia marcescens]HEJ9019051.1 hypothetical protein [Serratia marcescens]HEJ9023057.1 hypothetical protein [Serratia marcescens]HEJ9024782.1 hypothetical protein [Serratia marcescens]HEJ9040963.1 hypothetical protein [Serratia marcescens]